MIRKNRVLAAATAVLAFSSVAACGGGKDDNTSTGAKAEFNAALTKVFNPSDKKGGIIKMANSGDWDTLDPGETYYGYSWNFTRLYARSLLTFKIEPGKAGNELTPDLAEGLGEASNGNKTWTYKIRKGVKFEDGTEIKAADIKYAVLRSIDKQTFPNGPAYFDQWLNLPAGYKGPFKSPTVNTDAAISTPDDYTIVFNLKKPYINFNYLATLSQTAPVPKGKDTGAQYKQHVVSSGPYMFKTNVPGVSFSLVRNPNWDQASDPIRKALPDGFEVALKVAANDLDQRLINGDVDVEVAGLGVGLANQSRVLSDPNIKQWVDNPALPRLWYTSVLGTVPPLDNIECRKAVMFGADRTAYQTAYGGPQAGGEIATTVLVPNIPGYQKFDLYPSPDNKGDVAKAKEALTKCGQPNGFETNIAYRAERPKEKATAEALQQSLSRVGIKLTLKPYAQGDYFSQYLGNPPFAKANKLGLGVNGWGSDFNTGDGFLSQMTDSRVIRETGGSSNASVRIPEVDTLLDEGMSATDVGAANRIWGEVDKKVMESAYVLPGVYARSLLVRSKRLTNVFVSEAWAMYDYTALGVA